ncbi:hypothetical protein [Halorubrum sp. AJ67]|uniref:hypothetical protein n=1 Tax=Halorubrum sp. AJ67 TaxID=1173487 RepID=UPI0003DBBB0E|nr:hypothetical protein [Halorubrum sp. AJ67]CDK38045.1 hypothetical protein BN903_245 [Halorubrum sp. AJ67]
MAHHDIPDLPSGWVVSTNIEEHISLLRAEGETRYSIAIYPTNPATTRSGWTVMGLANYEPFRPVFTENASLEDALSTAIDEITAKINGEQIAHVRKAGSDQDAEPTDNPEPESADEDTETDSDSSDGQSDLNHWT